MLKQFIIGIFSSAVAHRIFPPPRTDGKSRSGSCILRLISLIIVIGLLCWMLGYGLFVAPNYILLTLYAGLKFLATNAFIGLDKLFYPGFDAPSILTWGLWGLIGGSAIQGCREMRRNGRKGQGLLVALAPLLLMFLTGTVKSVNVPQDPTQIIQQNEMETEKEPVTTTKTKSSTTTNTRQKPTTKTKPDTTTTTRQTVPKTETTPTTPRTPVRTTKREDSASPLPIKPTVPKSVPTQQSTGTTPTVAPKPSAPSVPVNMVLIPAGKFLMGSDEGDDEKPVHTVYIDAFYMDKYEVTNAQYKAFLQANPQWQKGRISSKYHDGDYLKHWNSNNYPNGKANHPVTFVSWYAAMAYAKWAGKRLPTEAEWEKAARGELIAKKYPWGDFIDTTKANYNKNVDDTTIVGKYQPNDYGLYDMAGNVLEWCIDMYDEDFYSSSSRQNPIAGGNTIGITANFLNVTTNRVLRGGSWSVLAQNVRAADRVKGNPTLSYYGAGFRCVRSVIPTMTKTSTTDTEKKTTTHRNPVRTTTDTPNAVPKARIQKVWVDHNQYQDSIKGMRIHVKFDIDNFKDTKGRVSAYFYTKNGDPLKDTNRSYYTTSGNVSTGRNFQSDYLKLIYNDCTLFMPYKELHLGRGKHNLKFYIRIFKSDTRDALSDKSDWVHFTATR